MTSGSPTGTYTGVLRLTARPSSGRSFATPTSEGLNGDTSGTVRVTVAPCTGELPATRSVEP